MKNLPDCCFWWRHDSKAQDEANALFMLQLRAAPLSCIVVRSLRRDDANG
jgi:hypothetical protein